jgi:hypothetical protein
MQLRPYLTRAFLERASRSKSEIIELTPASAYGGEHQRAGRLPGRRRIRGAAQQQGAEEDRYSDDQRVEQAFYHNAHDAQPDRRRSTYPA